MRFIFPQDGDCINKNDGTPTDGGILIEACVEASKDADIIIGGKKAEFSEGIWSAKVLISDYKTTLSAENRKNGEVCAVTLLKFVDPVGKFRLSSDDNILFLQDITLNRDKYTSIFDNPYLALYKKAHDRYGACVHLNLFYEYFPNDKNFSAHSEYFNLSMMTDKFKSEFEANSDWLKLAFHANSEFPDKPYKFATAEKIREDYERVIREIVRFAGESVITNSTTVHWGAANPECVAELHRLGLRSLTGYFRRNANGEPSVSYYFDGEALDHIGSRDFWYDKEQDMIFAQIDLVLNEKTYDDVVKTLPNIVNNPCRGGFISLMIHEQYFHPDYRRYLPDFEARVLDSCAFLAERRYVGEHIKEVVG
jgi:hypothetical protein